MEKLFAENLKMFSFSHLLILGITLLLVIFFYLIFFKRKHKTKFNFVYVLSILGFLAYVALPVLKLVTEKNVDVLAILPINLCGVCFLTAIILSRFQLPSVRAFVGYVGIFDALYNLIVIPNTYVGVKPFAVETILYFVPFVILLMVGLYTFAFGLVKPSFKQILKTVVGLIVVTVIMHTLNVVFKVFKLSDANYFYTLSASRDNVMKMLASLLPYEFVYLAFYLVAITVLMVIIALFGLASNKQFVNDIPVEELEEPDPKDGLDDIVEPQMNVGDDKEKWEEVPLVKQEPKEENIGKDEVEKEINQIEEKLKEENIDIDKPDLNFGDTKIEEKPNGFIETNNVSFNNENTAIQTEEKPINQAENSDNLKVDLNDSIFIKDEPLNEVKPAVEQNVNAGNTQGKNNAPIQAESKPEKVFMQEHFENKEEKKIEENKSSSIAVLNNNVNENNQNSTPVPNTDIKETMPKSEFKSLNSSVSNNIKSNPAFVEPTARQEKANDDVKARLQRLNQSTFKTKSQQNQQRAEQINRVKSLRSIVDKMGKKQD